MISNYYSIESALILMIDFWLKAINEVKIVGCVLVDFCNAPVICSPGPLGAAE